MKAKITNSCICCGTCASICPMGAIAMAATGDKYEVDPNKCIGCGLCANACHEGAIEMVDGKARDCRNENFYQYVSKANGHSLSEIRQTYDVFVNDCRKNGLLFE